MKNFPRLYISQDVFFLGHICFLCHFSRHPYLPASTVFSNRHLPPHLFTRRYFSAISLFCVSLDSPQENFAISFSIIRIPTSQTYGEKQSATDIWCCHHGLLAMASLGRRLRSKPRISCFDDWKKRKSLAEFVKLLKTEIGGIEARKTAYSFDSNLQRSFNQWMHDLRWSESRNSWLS